MLTGRDGNRSVLPKLVDDLGVVVKRRPNSEGGIFSSESSLAGT